MTTRLRTQRYVGAALAALLLSACANNKPEVMASPSADALIDVPKAVQRLAPSTLPLMTTPGTWLRPPKGPLFEPMDTLDPRNAMIYVYRPSSSWEDQELQAPSFFVDGRKVFGLKSGAYSWMELHAGEYHFYAKRPLSILFIKKVFELPLKIEGGKNYYFRYSEVSTFEYASEGFDPHDFQRSGFLQQVPESVALAEIAALKLDQQGVYLEAGQAMRQRFTPFEAFPETGVDPADLVEDDAAPDAVKETWWQRTRAIIGNSMKTITNRF